MKITPLTTRTILAASCLALAPFAAAQSPVPTGREITLDAPVPIASTANKKLPAFKSPPGDLKKVIEVLQEKLLTQALDPVNVLIAPEAERINVPALDFRNVSGADALSLIASAASCVLEPIHTPANTAGGPYGGNQPIVGYKLRPANAPVTLEIGSADLGGGLGSPAPSLLTQTSSQASPGGLGLGAGGAAPTPGSPSAPGFLGGGPSGGGVAAFGAPGVGAPGMPGFSVSPDRAVETCVYPIAAAKASTAFEEIATTLEDVLGTSGLPKDQVKLAFHEKTNVLVVRGPTEAQAIVKQLLTALEKNNAETSERGAAGKVAALEMKLQATMNELDRLRKLLDVSDAERRELEKQHQRLQDSRAPKKE